MFIMVHKNGSRVSVLDTKDGVVEDFNLRYLVDECVRKGTSIVGIDVRPEFGDGQDTFLDFEKSRRALVCNGFTPSLYGL